ncbi:MAG: hypothetical protein QM817_40950 [Archangium sp.]
MRMTGQTLNGTDWALLTPRSREWQAAWEALAVATGDTDYVAEDERTGEVWQYIGTVRLTGREWRHEFRHRFHPKAQERVVIRVNATRGWKPDKRSML